VGEDDKMFMTRCLDVTPKTTEHLTARSDKSVAYLTNNKRLYSTFCTVEANNRYEASRDLFATAELLVISSLVDGDQMTLLYSTMGRT